MPLNKNKDEKKYITGLKPKPDAVYTSGGQKVMQIYSIVYIGLAECKLTVNWCLVQQYRAADCRDKLIAANRWNHNI